MPEQPKFEQFSPKTEQLPGLPASADKYVEKLKTFIKEMSAELREEGLPVDGRGRIDMGQFGKAYDARVIESDKKLVEDKKAVWKRAATTEAERQYGWGYTKDQIAKFVEERTRMGETWEMLATTILHKRLGKDFAVVRTSEYDDFCNKSGKVDNLILDKKTGHIVCAFDEVVVSSKDETDQRLKEKEASIAQKNSQKGGVDLKYGIYFEESGGKTKLRKGRIEHLPVFCLAISNQELATALSDPDAEGELFQKMVASMKEQTRKIKEEPLDGKLKNHLDFFEKVFENL